MIKNQTFMAQINTNWINECLQWQQKARSQLKRDLLIKQPNYLPPPRQYSIDSTVPCTYVLFCEILSAGVKSCLQQNPGTKSAQVKAASPSLLLLPRSSPPAPPAPPSLPAPPGVPDGGKGIAELAVDAATVVELLVGRPRRALVLDAADATNAHDQDDQHQDESDAQGADDDVQGVPGHVAQTLRHVPRLPLEVCRQREAEGWRCAAAFSTGRSFLSLPG